MHRNDPFMPLSLPLLAATAPDHDYRFVDLLWDEGVDPRIDCDLVAISVRLTGEPRAYELARAFRARGIPVVLGGPQVSAVPLRAIRHADAVAVGEGEPLWPEIVADALKGTLKDFYVCSPEPFVAPPGRTVHHVSGFADLSRVPTPMRHLFKRRYHFDTVFSTRGCPIDCDFCSVSALFGKGFRHRPIQDVVREIDTFRNYFYLLDDTVFGKPSTYDYYLELYQAIAGLPRRRYWTGQANLDAAADPRGREVIDRAVDAGLLYAMVGMESVNPATLERTGAIRKMGARTADEVVDRMRENIRYLQDRGIILSGWFVVGYDDDTLQTYQDTLAFCREMHLVPVISPVKALPGTRLHHRLKADGRLDDSRLLNFRHPSMADEDVLAMRARITREGYTWPRIWERTRFYASRWKGEPAREAIHKIIFTWILQAKMRGGIVHDEFLPEEPDVIDRSVAGT